MTNGVDVASMTQDDDGDYWVARDGEGEGASIPSASLLHRTRLARSDPSSPDTLPALRAALPGAPPPLLAALYGPGAPRHVYLLVDGTLRAQVAGLFDFDVVAAPARSLFEGEAAETFGDAGPWLVDLSIADPEAPGDASLLRDLFARHWPAGFSILISTDTPFEALRGHLRRFTKLPVLDDGRVLTFRFWDPRVLGPFLDAIAGDAGRLRRMTMTDEGRAIAYFLPPFAEDGTEKGDVPAALQLTPDPALRAEPLRPMRLRYADFDATARDLAAARRARMAERLRTNFAAELSDRTDVELRAVVDAAVARFEAFGFREHAHLHLFAAWSLFHGPAFEQGDPTGELGAILRSDAPEADRFRAFRRRFDTFVIRETV